MNAPSGKAVEPFPPPLPEHAELLADAWGQVPLALALRETHRIVALQAILADRPATARILDVGVGDGSWWRRLRGERHEVYGIDINERELRRARRVIPHAARFDVSSPHLVDELRREGWPERYDGIIGNCSLEHVPDLEAALSNLRKLLAPGGWMVLFVPTPWWAMQGHLQSALAKHAPRIAMMASGAMNGFFQHWHLMDRPTWVRLLESHGFSVTSVMALADARSEFMFRLMLPTSLLAFAGKQLAGSYPNKLVPDVAVRALAAQVARLLDGGQATRSFDDEGATGADDADAYELAIRVTAPP